MTFDNHFLVRSTDPGVRFADSGDSGSLVVTEDGEALGLLFGKHDLGEGIVCPIDQYFENLGLSFPV